MDKFIKTADYATKEYLKNKGFTMLSLDSSSIWTFLIDKPMNFSEDIKKKIALTNVISL